MIRVRCTMSALTGTLMLIAGGAQATELLINGNMGSFGGAPASDPTVADGWFVTLPGPTLSQVTANSPFTNRFANNSSSWKRVDDNVSGTDGTRQHFSGVALPLVELNFDFYLDSLTNNPWGVQLDANNLTGSSSVAFRIDTGESGVNNNQFSINQTGAPAGFLDVLTLTAGKWYNVQATLDDAAATIIGTITPDGASPVPFSASMLSTHNGLSSVLIRDRDALVSGNLTVDNFSVIVPEPATMGLLAVGGLTITRRRRL